MSHQNRSPGVRSVFSSVFATALSLMLGVAAISAVSAQDAATPADAVPDAATPADAPQDASSVVIMSPDDEGVEQQIGTAAFTEENGEVTIYVEVEGLEPGDHGIHIHEIGICDSDADNQYGTAGDHFNPTGASHGPGPDAATSEANGEESHAGDLGNITIDEDGTGSLELTTDRISLAQDGENTLADDDGSALLIHAEPDDLETDPSGESGDRIACGVIFAGLDATPVV